MTASEFSALAATLSASARGLHRRMAVYRPSICPFGRLAERVPAGSRVLDVSYGQGMLLALLGASGRCGEGVGFDADAEAIAVARAMGGALRGAGVPRVAALRAPARLRRLAGRPVRRGHDRRRHAPRPDGPAALGHPPGLRVAAAGPGC